MAAQSVRRITQQPITLLRRLGVIAYDALLLAATLVCAAMLAYPFTHAQASLLYHLYLYLVTYLYFAWPWTHGGQTLGMLTWRVYLCRLDGQPVGWLDTLFRFSLALVSWACLGLGFWWSLWDKEKRTWHDIFSKTKLVKIA